VGNGPPKIVFEPGPIRVSGRPSFYLFFLTLAQLLCIPKLNTQININYCKHQTHEKSINTCLFFYHEGKTHEKSTNQPSSDMIKQWQQKNTSHLTNNINEVQIIEISTYPPK
jgi:hypothetical protein